MVDSHRAAARYDLLKHGYHIEDLGTDALWWPDAFALLYEQPPATSAVWRAIEPEHYDSSKIISRLEVLAVLLVRGQHMLGNQAEADTEKLPRTYEELFDSKEDEYRPQPLTFAEIDARMGWDTVEVSDPEPLTFDDIDERMGWR